MNNSIRSKNNGEESFDPLHDGLDTSMRSVSARKNQKKQKKKKSKDGNSRPSSKHSSSRGNSEEKPDREAIVMDSPGKKKKEEEGDRRNEGKKLENEKIMLAQEPNSQGLANGNNETVFYGQATAKQAKVGAKNKKVKEL